MTAQAEQAEPIASTCSRPLERGRGRGEHTGYEVKRGKRCTFFKIVVGELDLPVVVDQVSAFKFKDQFSALGSLNFKADT